MGAPLSGDVGRDLFCVVVRVVWIAFSRLLLLLALLFSLPISPLFFARFPTPPPPPFFYKLSFILSYFLLLSFAASMIMFANHFLMVFSPSFLVFFSSPEEDVAIDS